MRLGRCRHSVAFPYRCSLAFRTFSKAHPLPVPQSPKRMVFRMVQRVIGRSPRVWARTGSLSARNLPYSTEA